MATNTTTTTTSTTTLTTTTTHNITQTVARKDPSILDPNRRIRLPFTTRDHPRTTGDRAEDEPMLTFTENNEETFGKLKMASKTSPSLV